jgi:hypothetical protein
MLVREESMKTGAFDVAKEFVVKLNQVTGESKTSQPHIFAHITLF